MFLDDLTSMREAYGRIIAPGGQLQNPAYLPALLAATPGVTLAQLIAMAATPTRPALTAGMLVPGWNVGNPLRAGWSGRRGIETPVRFTNRYGALLRGTVYSPLPKARDPYTGRRLGGPFPGIVITPGSVQGSSGMYAWLAQDLAERGYVVLVYDVQGEGASETLPHDQDSDLPFCFPLAPPAELELLGCSGVPFQQAGNFVHGTRDATDFFFSTPGRPYPNPNSGQTEVDDFNPMWKSFDRSRLRRATAPGRRTKFAIIGHSLGAFAVSYVQGKDRRVSTVVALDKLGDGGAALGGPPMTPPAPTPKVPALGVQAEYGFTVTPSFLGGNSLVPTPVAALDPAREIASGYRTWTKAGQQSMVLTLRSSTHLDFTDIPLVLPASRYGQDVTSVYTQRWLDHWLKGRSAQPLLARRFDYLEPTAPGTWSRIKLARADSLSLRFCSAYRLRAGSAVRRNDDVTGVSAGRGC